MQRMSTLIIATTLVVALLGALGVQADDPDLPARPTTSGEALVGFAPDTMPDVHVGAAWNGFTVVQTIPQIDTLVVATDDLRAVLDVTLGLDHVTFVEDNGLLHASFVPDDARYDEQWGPAPMGFETAWDTSLGTSDVVVAVLDTGIRRSHNDFDDARILQGYDYVNNDNEPNDDCGHGTHVSGTVAATTNNGIGVAGMSQAKILHMKVLGPVGGLISLTCSGSTSDIADAITDATDQGAHIISMSLGGGGFSSTMNNAVNYAWNNDVLVVAAAGNDGSSNSVDYPAAYDNAIAVAALDEDLSVASYSDRGPEVEVAAPGSNVLSTDNDNDNDYASLSGTSMATPHVAGALALALSQVPGTSAASARSALHASAQDLGASGHDNTYGYGLARVDALVTELGGGSGGGNGAPTASFTSSVALLEVSFDASGSSDPDGDSLTYGWDFGDGNTGSGVAPTHTYAANGDYTVVLTVDDGNGGSDTASAVVSVNDGTDPDPSTPDLANGETVTVSLSGSGDEAFYKIQVPSTASQLVVEMDGPGCGLVGCSFDADLYTRYDQRPTDSQYDCRPYQSGNDESCTHDSPAAGYWYIRVDSYSGSGDLSLTATYS